MFVGRSTMAQAYYWASNVVSDDSSGFIRVLPSPRVTRAFIIYYYKYVYEW